MDGSDDVVVSGTNGGLRLVVGDLWTAGPRGLSAALAEALRRGVRDGRLPAGTPLPASRSLAADLAVSRGVVVRAYEQLVAEGYLRAHTGRGTVVGDVHAPAGVPAPPEDRSRARNPGLPALGWFPRREWLRAVERALEQLPDAELGYGDPRGHPRLRTALSAYLGRTRAVVAPPDRIVVTVGYAQGCRLIAEGLRHHGVDAVAVEDPGSTGVTLTMEAGGVGTVGVPVDDDGLDVDALIASGARAVVVTPAHQFPTGAVLAPARRAALLAWAAAGGVVVEDDYDAEFRYDRSPVGALQGLAPDRVVYGGSASKVLAPGVRLGWLVAPDWLAPALADAKFTADVATPVIDQVALAVLIESGALDRHIRRTGARYARRRERFRQAVATHLPAWRVTGVAAGLHAVLLPGPGVVAPDVEARTRSAVGRAGELGVVPLADHVRGEVRTGLVVGYAAATPDQIDRGVAALAAHLAG